MIEDRGFVYYGRHFRSADGSVPPAFGGLLQHDGSVSPSRCQPTTARGAAAW
jgi:hypothetical protein